VPDNLEDVSLAAEKIWRLAKSLGCPVLLIGLCKDIALEPSIRRQFISLSAMIDDGFVCVHAKVEFGSRWLQVIKSNWRAGDLLVCFAGQHAGLLQQPLSQLIESRLKLHPYILEDLIFIESDRSKWKVQAIAWAGSLVIIALFLLAQIQITRLPERWAQSLLMYLSIPLEVVLIWGWNTLFP
jgi:hypothetical protein